MSTAAERVADLSEAELFTSTALRDFSKKVRDLCRDLAYVLEFQADTLQASLATLPVVDGKYGSMTSRARARTVSRCLRVAADAVKHAGVLAVKSFVLFEKYYVAEKKRQLKKSKKQFDVDA